MAMRSVEMERQILQGIEMTGVHWVTLSFWKAMSLRAFCQENGLSWTVDERRQRVTITRSK